MNVYFINDTSWYHIGSKTVMSVIRNQIFPDCQEVKDINQADFVVCNGEGTLHHSNTAFHKTMTAILDALLKNKPTFLINTVWHNNTHQYDLLLKKLTWISCREILSAAQLVTHGIKPKVRLDLSCFAPIKKTSFQDFNGAEVVGECFYNDFHVQNTPLASFPKLFLHKQNNWSTLVNSLRTASLYITGLHHGMFAACKARVPFVTFSHNTHKIKGVLEWAGVPISVPRNPKEVLEARIWALRHKDQYHRLFDWMDKQVNAADELRDDYQALLT